MLYNAALVLEGGAMRGQYSTGITDLFLKHHLEFRSVIGVSAGALCGANFVSKQYGRMVNINTHYRHNRNYISPFRLLRRQEIVNLDFLFEDHGWSWHNFDERAYHRAASNLTIVATTLKDGKAVVFTNPSGQEFINDIKASSSIPFVNAAQRTPLGDCLDGGIADSIPFDIAQQQGYNKIVVIRTRTRDYRKKLTSKVSAEIYRRYFRNYPEFAEKSIQRPAVYNQQVSVLNQLEKKGQIFVIAPETPIKVRRLESNVKKLQALYQQGQNQAAALLPQLTAYLEK